MEIYMKKETKKIKFFALLFLIGCCVGICSVGVTKVDAYSTRNQIKTALNKTKKKMKKVKASYQSEKKKMKEYKKKSRAYYKGAKPILMASIVLRDPLVIYQAGTYYRITNSASSQIWFGKYLGHIRMSSGYSNINGYYCRNATAVISPYSKKQTQATLAYKRHLKEYKKLAKKKKQLDTTLNFTISKDDIDLYVGNTKELKPKKTYYNKIKIMSSNPAVLRVEGTKIRALSAGQATIKATYSISNKKTAITVRVLDKEKLELNYSSYYLEEGKTLELKGKKGRTYGDYDGYSWTSSNPSIAKVSRRGKVTAVSYGTAVISVTDGCELGTCIIIVGEAVVPQTIFDASEFNFTQEDIGTQKTIGFTSNLQELEFHVAEGRNSCIHIDRVDYVPTSDPHNMVSGSITFTILESGKDYIWYEYGYNGKKDLQGESKAQIYVSELKIYDASCWLSKERNYKNVSDYGNPGELTSATGYDSSILSCEVGSYHSLYVTTYKAGKTNITLQTSTGYSRTFPFTVYGVNYYDSQGKFMEKGESIVKEYDKSLDSCTEEERTDYINVESFLPEPEEESSEDIKLKLYCESYNSGVLELGEYVDGKQYFHVKGKGIAKIYARYGSYSLGDIFVEVK